MEGTIDYKSLVEKNFNQIHWEIKLPEFSWTYISPQIERLRGFTAEEGLRQSLEDALTKESYQIISYKIQNELTQTSNGKDLQTIKLESFCKDGKTKWFLVDFSVIRDSSGQPKKIIGVSTDIDETEKMIIDQRKRIEQLEAITKKMSGLREVLPICASCKKIRKEDGVWEQLEAYLNKNFFMNFSHGICKECAKKLYPDLDL